MNSFSFHIYVLFITLVNNILKVSKERSDQSATVFPYKRHQAWLGIRIDLLYYCLTDILPSIFHAALFSSFSTLAMGEPQGPRHEDSVYNDFTLTFQIALVLHYTAW